MYELLINSLNSHVMIYIINIITKIKIVERFACQLRVQILGQSFEMIYIYIYNMY